MSNEELKITEIDKKASRLRSTLNEIYPIWHSMNRKVYSLKEELKHLEDERAKLSQGQMIFDCTLDF